MNRGSYNAFGTGRASNLASGHGLGYSHLPQHQGFGYFESGYGNRHQPGYYHEAHRVTPHHNLPLTQGAYSTNMYRRPLP
jgi:hypothetical protein